MVLLAAATTTAVQKWAVWGCELTVSVNCKEEGVQLESKRDRGGPCHSSFISLFFRLMLYINRLSCRSLLAHSTPRPESKPKELHLHPKPSSNLLTLYYMTFVFFSPSLLILISILNHWWLTWTWRVCVYIWNLSRQTFAPYCPAEVRVAVFVLPHWSLEQSWRRNIHAWRRIKKKQEEVDRRVALLLEFQNKTLCCPHVSTRLLKKPFLRCKEHYTSWCCCSVFRGRRWRSTGVQVLTCLSRDTPPPSFALTEKLSWFDVELFAPDFTSLTQLDYF